ncbi:MAG: hypothetical protein AB8C95_03205 [Phycisphaeraceae bacterium]
MDYEPLDIKDSKESTEGGPPGWLAFSVIVGCVAVMAVVAVAFGLAT